MINFKKIPAAWQLGLRWAKNTHGYFLDAITRTDPRFPQQLSQHDSERKVFHFLRPIGNFSAEAVDINGSLPQFQLIFIDFANIKIGDQTQNLLEFYNRYGSLFQRAPGVELNPFETESSVLGIVDSFRKFLDDIEELRRTKTHRELRFGEPLSCEFDLRLSPESTNLIVRPETLYGFILLQIYRWASTGRALDKCRVCGKFMMPKSSKREFCSSTCRSRANRSKERIR